MRCSICTSQNTEIICRTSDIEYNTTKDIYEYYKCLDCGVIFLSNIPEDILNIIYHTVTLSNALMAIPHSFINAAAVRL